MRVLLLTYYFPPSRPVGALRAEKVAQAFRSAGHTVRVITERLPGDPGRVRSSTPGLEVGTIQPIPSPRELYLRARARLRRAQAVNDGPMTSGEGEHWTVPKHVSAWKRFLYSLLWLPDDRQGFIPPAVRAGRAAINDGIDLLYTSAPPFSVHLAGLILKRMTGVKWAAEFRDPWMDNPFRPWYVRSSFGDAAGQRLERACLRRADHIVAVSEGIYEALAAKLDPDARQRIVVARNGIEQFTQPPADRVPGPFRIVHVGSLYHQRNPFPFLIALAELRRKHALAASDLLVEFIGRSRWFGGASVEEKVRDLNLADVVRFQDWLPHEDCRDIVRRADLLLLLAQDQPAQVPNKLYEYLGTRLPILAFVDEEGETARMLRQVGGHYLVTSDDVATIARVLEAALGRAPDLRKGTVDESVLAQWTTKQQMSALLAAVGA